MKCHLKLHIDITLHYICVQVELLQRQLNDAVKLVQSQHGDQCWRARSQHGEGSRPSPHGGAGGHDANAAGHGDKQVRVRRECVREISCGFKQVKNVKLKKTFKT